jgi:hypothetical protein
LSGIISAQNNFIQPFKIGNYYEYNYNFEYGTIRYSAKVTNDTIINGIKFYKLTFYNEPPINQYSVYYFLDTFLLNLYGGDYGCPVIGNQPLACGFNLPIGYIWNTCYDTSSLPFFRSIITDTFSYSGYLNYNQSLKFVSRKDTAGFPIDGTTIYGFCEKFGFFYFYRGYGNPFSNSWYEKTLEGAIIDSTRYGTITMNINKISNFITAKFILEQNYPNPFNSSTIIKFDIPKSGFIKLTISDLLGKEIESPVNEYKIPGIYQYIFNSGNLSSGIYFYRLQTDNFVQTKKMVVIK